MTSPSTDNMKRPFGHLRDPTQEGSRPFRFKTGNPALHTDHDKHATERRHHHSSHHNSSLRHHRKKRKTTPASADDYPSRARRDDGLHPETAFLESLFDAMGDDEGASYWEGVYGQPIHNYSHTYRNEQTGELESMTDDEYAQYVRRKMWEKSWEGIEAQREQRRREKEREKRDAEAESKSKPGITAPGDGASVFDFDIEQSLRRGELRKKQKRWHGLWTDYIHRWDELQALAHNRREAVNNAEQLHLRDKIAWPTESGRREDINRDEVARFICNGIKHAPDSDLDTIVLQQVLKLERVRWHPDKVQQRFGFMTIDDLTSRSVTAVFQILDDMWNEIRA